MAEGAFQKLLADRSRSPNSTFHKFRLQVSSGLSKAIFVEGYDDRAFFSSLLPYNDFDHKSVWVSFGKISMAEIVRLYFENDLGNRCDARFIRDADFDEFLGTLPQNAKLYVLDRYSIENFIFTSNAFERFLTERLALDPDEFNVTAAAERYNSCVESIFEAICPLIGAALASIRQGHSIDLDQFDVTRFAKMFLKTGKCPPLSENDFTKCKIPPESVNIESLNLGKNFNERDAMLWMRGHYLSIIFCENIKFTIDEAFFLKRQKKITSFNRKATSDINPHSLFERVMAFSSAGPWFFQALS